MEDCEKLHKKVNVCGNGWGSGEYSSKLFFRWLSPHKLEIIESCFTSQECIPVKILYILFPCLFCLEEYLKPQCWMDSLFLCVSVLTGRGEDFSWIFRLQWFDILLVTGFIARTEKRRLEKLRTNICNSLTPGSTTSQNLQLHGVKRKESWVLSCPCGWEEITVTTSWIVLQAVGVTRDPGRRESSALYIQEPKRICSARGYQYIQDFNLINLPDIFW